MLVILRDNFFIRKEKFHLKYIAFMYRICGRKEIGSHRLAVRTPDSHSGNTGSIPVGSAKFDHRSSEPANLVTRTCHALLITQLMGFLFTRFPVGSAKFDHCSSEPANLGQNKFSIVLH